MSRVGPIAIIPVRAGRVAPGGAEVVSLVSNLASSRTILVGDGIEDAVAELMGLVGRLEVVEVPDFAPAGLAASLASHLGTATFVLLPSSPGGRDLAPRLAAELGLPLYAGALDVGTDEVVVARQGGLVQATFRPGGPFVATLQPGVRAVDAGDSPTTVVPLPLEPAERRDAHTVAVLPPDAATMDLAEAPRIVGAGAGLMAGEPDEVRRRFETLTAVGEAVGASMGATRVVTDAGWVGHARQIGTTGVVVDPHLYLAFAISGAVQHTAGLGHPDHIVSVNLDPHCPMMAMADLAVVADANATLDALAARLGVARSAVGVPEGVEHG